MSNQDSKGLGTTLEEANGQYDENAFDALLSDIATLDDQQTALDENTTESTCKITLKRPGKKSLSMTVNVGTKLTDVIAESGWGSMEKFTFSRRLAGDEQEIIDHRKTVLGEGEHIIYAAPKVVGG